MVVESIREVDRWLSLEKDVVLNDEWTIFAIESRDVQQIPIPFIYIHPPTKHRYMVRGFTTEYPMPAGFDKEKSRLFIYLGDAN